MKFYDCGLNISLILEAKGVNHCLEISYTFTRNFRLFFVEIIFYYSNRNLVHFLRVIYPLLEALYKTIISSVLSCSYSLWCLLYFVVIMVVGFLHFIFFLFFSFFWKLTLSLAKNEEPSFFTPVMQFLS